MNIPLEIQAILMFCLLAFSIGWAIYETVSGNRRTRKFTAKIAALEARIKALSTPSFTAAAPPIEFTQQTITVLTD